MRVRVPLCPIVFLILGVVVLLQLFCLPGQYIGKEGDGVFYVLASRSLLSGGYTLGISPGDPPLTFLTPGWPALLLPAAAISGDSAGGYHLWSWLWLALADVLLWMWLRRRMGGAAALAATALFGLNPLVLSRAGAVLSEIPCLALSLLLLNLLDREKGLAGWKSGLFLGFSWLVRPAVLPLFPAVWGYYLWRGRRRDAVLSALCSLAPIAVWLVWVSAVGGKVSEAEELSSTLLRGGLSVLPGVGFHNALGALRLWGETMLPWPPSASPSPAALVLGAGLFAAASAGVVIEWRRSGYETAGLYLLLAVAMHAIWPWWFERYLPPLLPFLIWGLWSVLRRALRSERAAVCVLAVLAVVPVPGQGFELMRRAAARQRPEFASTYRWIKENTEPGALFTSALYHRDAYYTGRPFVPLPDLGAPGVRGAKGAAEVLRSSSVRYVLWYGVPELGSSLGAGFHWSRSLRGLASDVRGPRFRELRSFPEEGSAVYEVLRSSAPM
ncbi:hypothetical protein ACFL2T_06785 [Elusimicrobiota bacterium]